MFAQPKQTQAKTPTGRAEQPARSSEISSENNPVWQALALRQLGIPPRLSVSQPDDPDEQDSERVAERVMSLSCPRTEEEDFRVIQPQPEAASATTEATSSVPYQSEMETAFGRSFRDVLVDLGSAAAKEKLASVHARGASVGNAIIFDISNPSRELVAHELTHVVQATQSGQRADDFASQRLLGKPSDPSEREAGVVARQIVAGGRVTVSERPTATVSLDGCEGADASSAACNPASLFSPSQLTFLSNVGVNVQTLSWEQAGRLASDLTQFENMREAASRGGRPTASGSGSINVRRNECSEEITYTVPGRIDIYWRMDQSAGTETYEFRYRDPVFATRGVRRFQQATAEGGQPAGTCAPIEPPQVRSPAPPTTTHVAPPVRRAPPSEDNTRINNVVQRLREGRWDVDSLTAQLTDTEMRRVSASDRVGLIRHISGGYIVGDEDEQTIIRLLATTPDPQARAVIGMLDRSLLQQLEAAIDFSEYRQYHTTLRTLFFRSRTPEETLSQIEHAQAFPWASPGLIRSLWGQRFHYDDIEFTESGRLRISYWIQVGPIGLHTQAVEVEPFQVIAVRFFADEAYAEAREGQVVFMPAINLRSLYRHQFRNEMQTAVEVPLLIGGGLGVVGAASRLARAVAALEVAFGAADLVIRDFRSRIGQSQEGRAFLEKWDIVSVLIIFYGVGRAVTAVPQAFRSLREFYRAYRAARGGQLNTNEIQQIEQRVNQVLNNADEALAASGQTGTTGPQNAATPTSPTTSAPGTTAPTPQAGQGGAPTAPVTHPPGTTATTPHAGEGRAATAPAAAPAVVGAPTLTEGERLAVIRRPPEARPNFNAPASDVILTPAEMVEFLNRRANQELFRVLREASIRLRANPTHLQMLEEIERIRTVTNIRVRFVTQLPQARPNIVRNQASFRFEEGVLLVEEHLRLEGVRNAFGLWEELRHEFAYFAVGGPAGTHRVTGLPPDAHAGRILEIMAEVGASAEAAIEVARRMFQ